MKIPSVLVVSALVSGFLSAEDAGGQGVRQASFAARSRPRRETKPIPENTQKASRGMNNDNGMTKPAFDGWDIPYQARDKRQQTTSNNEDKPKAPIFDEKTMANLRKASQEFAERYLQKPKAAEGETAEKKEEDPYANLRENLRQKSQQLAEKLKDGKFNMDDLLGAPRQRAASATGEATDKDPLDLSNFDKAVRQMSESLGLGDMMKDLKQEDIEAAQKQVESLLGKRADKKGDANKKLAEDKNENGKKPAMNFFDDLFKNWDLSNDKDSDDPWGLRDLGTKKKDKKVKPISYKNKGTFQNLLDSDEEWTATESDPEQDFQSESDAERFNGL